jgi:hypothetical protein
MINIYKPFIYMYLYIQIYINLHKFIWIDMLSFNIEITGVFLNSIAGDGGAYIYVYICMQIYIYILVYIYIYTDITEGDINCVAGGGSASTCCTEGFSATEGWDPAAGVYIYIYICICIYGHINKYLCLYV